MSTDRLERCLEKLQDRDYKSEESARRCDALAERALRLTFEAGCERADLERAGWLATLVLPHLQGHVERVACAHRRRLDIVLLRERSALQFLIDRGGQDELEEHLAESVRILDDLIERWRDASSDEEDEEYGAHEPICSPDGVPRHHTWWY